MKEETPITEEGLTVLGFKDISHSKPEVAKYVYPGLSIYVYINHEMGGVITVDFISSELESICFPGCKNMKDLTTLIRLLGGAQ